nr:MAG TPA: hypothetical protein [Caudoviricetes sp.]DAZ26933.1 MAG TPA: hypothetical protein [Caudoviricetes sp.]
MSFHRFRVMLLATVLQSPIHQLYFAVLLFPFV